VSGFLLTRELMQRNNGRFWPFRACRKTVFSARIYLALGSICDASKPKRQRWFSHTRRSRYVTLEIARGAMPQVIHAGFSFDGHDDSSPSSLRLLAL
jgi:hypothetical protein